MLDDKDIQKLTLILATKEDIDGVHKEISDVREDFANQVSLLVTKKDFNELRQDVADLRELLQGLLVATDKMAKSMEILGAEYKAVSVQLIRHEKWIKQLSEKAGVQLSYE